MDLVNKIKALKHDFMLLNLESYLDSKQKGLLDRKLAEYIIGMATADPEIRRDIYHEYIINNGGETEDKVHAQMREFASLNRDDQLDIIRDIIDENMNDIRSFWGYNFNIEDMYYDAYLLLLLSVLTPDEVNELQAYVNTYMDHLKYL